jgi:tRNA U34 5-methylaminomethyl-2-thiouridine-forming methyltransferase MnmC
MEMLPANERKLVITEDGSHTLFVPSLHEHYHSVHGAIRESRVVFIEAGLHHCMMKTSTIKILEVGFGTGLNALLTWLEAEKLGLSVQYTGIEAYPLSISDASKLNYTSFLVNPNASMRYKAIHDSPWNTAEQLSDCIRLEKLDQKLQEVDLPDLHFNLVYFDAFSPESQPELWTEEIFRKISASMLPEGFLVTYSCKGNVKRALKSCGFAIEKLPGPPGKREILRAQKGNR